MRQRPISSGGGGTAYREGASGGGTVCVAQ